MKIEREKMTRLWQRGVLWAGVIVTLGLALGWPPYQDARIWPDSASYLGFSGARMPVYSLLTSLLGNHYALICVQFALSLLSWSWLGWAVARTAGVLVASCFALSAPIVMWDLSVLSESLSLTLMAASLAATITLYHRWTTGRYVVWCVTISLFAMTRATNAFLIPFLVVPFALASRRSLIRASVAALVVITGAALYVKTAGRPLQMLSLANVYTARILTSRDRIPYFVERGMPVTEEMGPYVGKTGRKNARRLLDASPEFADWFEKKGVSAYYRWVLTRPSNFSLPAVTVVRNLNYPNLQYAEGTRPRALYTHLMWFYSFVQVPWWLWLVGLLVPVLSWWLGRRITPESMFVPALMMAVYAQAYAGYHGDAAEVSRHVLLAMVLYKTTLLIAIAVVLGILLRWRRSGVD